MTEPNVSRFGLVSAVATFALLCATPATSVNLSRADLFLVGDQRVVHDADSGLDWLDLDDPTTFALSYDDAETAVAALPGTWRHATAAEVCDLLKGSGTANPADPCPGTMLVTGPLPLFDDPTSLCGLSLETLSASLYDDGNPATPVGIATAIYDGFNTFWDVSNQFSTWFQSDPWSCSHLMVRNALPVAGDGAKISDLHSYLSGPGSPGTNPGGLLADGDNFGWGVEGIGDLDLDGVPDIAVGAIGDDLGGSHAGAAYILFLNADGTVKARQKIGEGTGGLLASLDVDDDFGTDIALIHDVDGDGVQDIAVAAPGDDDGANGSGALYILFLNTDGTVKAEQKISNLAGGLGAVNDLNDRFGSSPASVGDLDGDGIPDIAVGSTLDTVGGFGSIGSVHILFLNADGTVKASQKIARGVGGFTSTLGDGDHFGSGIANLGDLDGDGRPELAVGAELDGTDEGSVYILSLNSDGTVNSEREINDGESGFVGPTDANDRFSRVARLGDLDGDGTGDLAVGAYLDDDAHADAGAVWILYLNPDGSVHAEEKISAASSTLSDALDPADLFGLGVTSPGDVDGDGMNDLVVGSPSDDDGGVSRGAAYVLFLDGAVASCGNGVLDPIEMCDDGNTVGGDGCPADCAVVLPEPGLPTMLLSGATLLQLLRRRRPPFRNASRGRG